MSAGAGAAREVTAERSVLTGQSRDARTSAPRGTSARPSREASAPAGIRVLPAGSGALLVELSSGEHAEAFHAELLRRRARGELPAVREIVPGARTVLLDGIADGSARLARELVSWEIPPLRRDTGEAVEIPVVYDGPDLADVAVAWGVTVADVPRIHAGTEFRVAFCGFAPGFGYLTGLPEHLHMPRRATPRTRVPAGALALAGAYTGVYPRPSPGGWQIIGRMPEPGELWNPAREPAALLSPGARVRFVAAEVRP
ncbi:MULTISPECIES: 5-oxoprolinase subunit B family protein [unclassified Streptomyces]|uniref:5-oxoprolinase subunit B family protein n=1 Tax=unclassified Streptomyces TaxID=2593676 RepID=UPI002DDBF43E|nr:MULTISPECIES: allophanate hydrolase subunit 1 [unclassified Streptomyces]WSF85290.1 allophanate hydrolase subunit 1 [Streptomyces sp. NBC_01744]WSC38420.1 allophanate hydrolase subunit 1 [Streptomyces sp. NBC_01763]WSC46557.1 allophanate hydrolase subunit 1 [Streptomyces sp. NBC_01762]WSC54451.1 allophanate hydrolase subunit 1 [Streptomyces sp. NBC_01761]WSD26208.1 allophanate hydrolase subunit 1 [Streptomyces sp. NBC_01751]